MNEDDTLNKWESIITQQDQSQQLKVNWYVSKRDHARKDARLNYSDNDKCNEILILMSPFFYSEKFFQSVDPAPQQLNFSQLWLRMIWYCHNPSPSPSPKSEVWSPKLKGLGVTLFCCATTTTTHHTNFSQQPDILLSSNFHSRLSWPRLNEFRTNQEPSPPQIQLLTWRTG